MMTSPPLINPPPPWPSSSSSSISSLLAASRSSSHNNNGNINGNINGNNNNNKKQPKQRQVQAAYVDHTYTDYSLLSEYELQLLENNDETNTHNNDEESSDASSARGITRASSLPPGGVATTTPSGDEDSNNDNNNYCTDNNNDDSQQQQQQQQQQINSSNKKRRIELRTKLLHCMTDTYGPVKKNAGGVVHTFPSKVSEYCSFCRLHYCLLLLLQTIIQTSPHPIPLLSPFSPFFFYLKTYIHIYSYLRYSIELTCMTLYIGCHTVVPSWYLNHNYSPRTYYPATSNKPST
jgi:hypothetical protein